jgi:hypothetical protein
MTHPARPASPSWPPGPAETSGNLDAHIAAPRLAVAEASAAERIAADEGAYEAELRRATDLQTELRRQLDAQLAQVARLRWVAITTVAALRLWRLE